MDRCSFMRWNEYCRIINYAKFIIFIKDMVNIKTYIYATWSNLSILCSITYVIVIHFALAYICFI